MMNYYSIVEKAFYLCIIEESICSGTLEYCSLLKLCHIHS